MIEALDISLSFNGKPVFSKLSFNIEQGDNVCFSRPSGKGKSTLLKMLQGYVLPAGGALRIAGKELNPVNVRHIRQMMAYIPQNINLPVTNGRELLKMTGVEMNGGLAGDYIEELGMTASMLDRDFAEMSGGQMQRIVVAICLSLDRDIILLDEPTSSLDDESTGRLLSVLNNLENKTVVSASHNHKWLQSAGKVIAL